jgi:hypothetical protein
MLNPFLSFIVFAIGRIQFIWAKIFGTKLKIQVVKKTLISLQSNKIRRLLSQNSLSSKLFDIFQKIIVHILLTK